MITHALDQFILDHKSKQDKFNWIWILKKDFTCGTPSKLLDEMCKYEMDLASIEEDTERTRFCPQMDRWTGWNQYTPFNFIEQGV